MDALFETYKLDLDKYYIDDVLPVDENGNWDCEEYYAFLAKYYILPNTKLVKEIIEGLREIELEGCNWIVVQIGNPNDGLYEKLEEARMFPLLCMNDHIGNYKIG